MNYSLVLNSLIWANFPLKLSKGLVCTVINIIFRGNSSIFVTEGKSWYMTVCGNRIMLEQKIRGVKPMELSSKRTCMENLSR